MTQYLRRISRLQFHLQPVWLVLALAGVLLAACSVGDARPVNQQVASSVPVRQLIYQPVGGRARLQTTETLGPLLLPTDTPTPSPSVSSTPAATPSATVTATPSPLASSTPGQPQQPSSTPAPLLQPTVTAELPDLLATLVLTGTLPVSQTVETPSTAITATATLLPFPTVTYIYPQQTVTGALLSAEHPPGVSGPPKDARPVGSKAVLAAGLLILLLAVWAGLALWFLVAYIMMRRQ